MDQKKNPQKKPKKKRNQEQQKRTKNTKSRTRSRVDILALVYRIKTQVHSSLDHFFNKINLYITVIFELSILTTVVTHETAFPTSPDGLRIEACCH